MGRYVTVARFALPCCLAVGGCASLAPKPEAPTPSRSFQPSLSQNSPPEAAVAKPSPEALLESQVMLASHHTARQEWPQAQSCLDKALATSPKHLPALAQLAKLHLARGDEPKARSVLQQILALDPGAPLAWNEVANLRSAAGDYQGAVDALTKALERSPNQTLYLENLGAVYALAGDYGSAYEAYARALGPAEARLVACP